MPHAASYIRQRVAALVGASSVELTPREASDSVHELLPAGATVFVSSPPSATYADVVAASALLRRAGFNVVPHVVARRLASFSEAADFLPRVVDQAGGTEILLLGGDMPRPQGPFHDALAVLSTGLLERHGIRSVAFAGYPEGHPQIGRGALHAALQAKLEVARQRGLAPSLVTQFGFEAAPIHRWLAERRAEGVACPIRIGLAGPASVATLAKYAVRCGIGASLRALTHGHAAIARILSEADPDALIDALVANEDPAAPIDGLHVFSFGGTRKTAEWRKKFLSRVT